MQLSIELDEAVAGDGMILTRNAQRHRTRAGRDQDVTGLESAAFDHDRLRDVSP